MKPVDKKRFDSAVIGITFMLVAIFIMQLLASAHVPNTARFIPVFVLYIGIAFARVAVD